MERILKKEKWNEAEIRVQKRFGIRLGKPFGFFLILRSRFWVSLPSSIGFKEKEKEKDRERREAWKVVASSLTHFQRLAMVPTFFSFFSVIRFCRYVLGLGFSHSPFWCIIQFSLHFVFNHFSIFNPISRFPCILSCSTKKRWLQLGIANSDYKVIRFTH